MLLRSVFTKSLRDERRALLWWSLGLGVMSAYIVALFPSVEKHGKALSDLFEQMPPAARALVGGDTNIDYATGAGYLSLELFSLTVPLLFLIFSIVQATKIVAGEQERGTLELLLSWPVRRSRVLLGKWAAVSVSVVVLGIVLWAALSIGVTVVGVPVSIARLAAATGTAAALSLLYGTLALACAGITGRRGVSAAVSAVAALAGYLVASLGSVVDGLKSVRRLSPFFHYLDANSIHDGLAVGSLAVLLALTLVLAAAAVIGFERRDIAT